MVALMDMVKAATDHLAAMALDIRPTAEAWAITVAMEAAVTLTAAQGTEDTDAITAKGQKAAALFTAVKCFYVAHVT